MGGIFSKSNRPKRPGAYVNWAAAEQEVVVASSLGVTAVPFQHPWGPANTVVPLNDLGQFIGIFGLLSPASSGHRAVDYAFRGAGVPGEYGAGQVLGYRMVGTGAAIAHSGAALGAQLSLEAIYQGTYGNNLKVAVVSDASDATNYHNLVIFDGSTEIERYRYPKTDITALAAEITNFSSWVRPKGAVTTGTALTLTTVTPPATLAQSAAPFTTGANGTIAAGDYTTALSALDAWRFGLLAFDYLTDESIHTSLATWVQTANNSGKRVMAVVGGLPDEALGSGVTTPPAGSAVKRSKTIYNSENVVSVGVGSVRDPRYGVLGSAALAPRVAGVLAARGETRNLTFARLQDLEIVKGPTNQEVLDAIDNGTVVLARDSHPTAPVRVEKGVTTYCTTNNPQKPKGIYSVPKFVRTMHALEMELTEFAEFNVIGNMSVSDDTRSYLRADCELRLAAREGAGIVQPGWTVDIDRVPSPEPEDEFVGLVLQMRFGRSLEQIYYTITVS